MLSKPDYEKLQLPGCDADAIKEFLETINNDTLGRKVAVALYQRKQGHFDKAMLSISEANRDQVLAIREIQAVLDKLAGRNKTEIVLEKFRQTYPFQIGLTNGEEILGLLAEITSQYDNGFSNIINELCDNEDQLDSLNEEIAFYEERMRSKISEEELDELRKKRSDIVNAVDSVKLDVLGILNNVVNRNISHAGSNEKLTVIKNLFIIITSSIETLDAKIVEA